MQRYLYFARGFFVFLIVLIIPPLLLSVRFQITGQNWIWGLPAFLDGVFGALGLEFTGDDTYRIGLNIGLLVTAALLAYSGKLVSSVPIKLGVLNWKVIYWIAAAALLSLFARIFITKLFVLMGSTSEEYIAPNVFLPHICTPEGLTPVQFIRYLSSLFGALIFAPLFEEYIFRGYLTNLSLQTFSQFTSAILVSVLFSILHFTPQLFSVAHLIIFCLAILQFSARVAFDGIGAPILLHSIYNLGVGFTCV